MSKTFVSTVLASALAFSASMPAMAADDALGEFASLLGATTATVITVPQAMAVDTLWHSPRRAQRALAEAFGDQSGLAQNIMGAVIGIPFGMAWGLPSGALRGAKHGLGVGWDKPFSTESFVCLSADES